LLFVADRDLWLNLRPDVSSSEAGSSSCLLGTLFVFRLAALPLSRFEADLADFDLSIKSPRPVRLFSRRKIASVPVPFQW